MMYNTHYSSHRTIAKTNKQPFGAMCNTSTDDKDAADLSMPLTRLDRRIRCCLATYVISFISVITALVVTFFYNRGLAHDIMILWQTTPPVEDAELQHFLIYELGKLQIKLHHVKIALVCIVICMIMVPLLASVKLYALKAERDKLRASVKQARANQGVAEITSELMASLQLTPSANVSQHTATATFHPTRDVATVNQRQKFIFVNGEYIASGQMPSNAFVLGEMNVVMAAATTSSDDQEL